MTDAEDQLAAAKKALAEAEAALAAAEKAATRPPSSRPTSPRSPSRPPHPAHLGRPLSKSAIETITAGYSFDAPALEMGALVNGEPIKEAQIRIPIAMVNRHGSSPARPAPARPRRCRCSPSS